MRINEAAQKYASALFETTAENKIQDQTLSELRLIADVFAQQKEALEFFSTPSITVDNKEKVLTSTFGKAAPSVLNLLLLLNEKGRMSLFTDIVAGYQALIDQSRGVSRGTVRSASILSSDEAKKLEATVNRITGNQVVLQFEVDPSLSGGLIAQLKGWTFDDSLAFHLTAMREDLNRKSHAH